MATTTTPTPPAPKPAVTPAKPDAKHDPADENSPPYDPAKEQPYKPPPSTGGEADPPAKPATGSTSYNTLPG